MTGLQVGAHLHRDSARGSRLVHSRRATCATAVSTALQRVADRVRIVAVGASLLCLIAPVQVESQVPSIPLPAGVPFAVDSVVVVGREVALAQPVDTYLGPDGSLHVIDLGNTRVYKFAPSGKLLWQFGREGGGPGEFRMPYRLCVLADLSVLVWDEGTQKMTKLDADGRYVWQRDLDIIFSSVDNVLGLPGGRVAVTGVAGSPEAHTSSIHIFTDSLKHLRSFGALPNSRMRYALDSWGAGTTSLTPAKTILFVRRLPYEVVDFKDDGSVLRRFTSEIGSGKSADDGVTLTRTNGRVVRRINAIVSPGRAVVLPSGHYWGGHSIGRDRYWDVFAPTGKLLSSNSVPPGVHYLVGYDHDRSVLWFRGVVADEPVFLRAHVRATSGIRSR